MERQLTAGVLELLKTAGSNETQEKKQERKIYAVSDRFVNYPKAIQYLDRLEELLYAPNAIRPESLAIIGDANNGKSGLLRNFVSTRAAPVDDPKEPSARIPALYIMMGADIDEVRIYHWILNRLLAPYKDKDRQDKKFNMIKELVERLSIRMLIFDEFHHILGVTGSKQRRCLNVIKTLTSELGIPIVISGIPEVLPLLRTDPQIETRFEAVSLPRWGYGMEYRQFLAGLEADFPLLEVSNLGSKQISRRVYDLSEGLLGESVKLLKRAASAAVGMTEKITLESIGALNPVPPSLRHSEIENSLAQRG